MTILMNMKKLMIVAVATALFSTTLDADHTWDAYHWARTSTANPVNLIVVNSTTSGWDGYVAYAIEDWSQSDVLTLVEENGSTSRKARRRCQAPSGKIRVCNLAYGQTGWLGIAGISIDTDGHIFAGYTKLNDTYFSWDYYNDSYWKQSVTCQEIGHAFGLDHQDEDLNSVIPLDSCMDYQDPPWPSPNDHDFEQLGIIYDHGDGFNSFAEPDNGEPAPDGGGGSGCNAPKGKGCNKARGGESKPDKGWGVTLGRRGAKEKFIRIDRDGTRHITSVTWAGGH